MAIFDELSRRLLSDGTPDVYSVLTDVFGRLDYKVAYIIDRFRRQRMKTQRLGDLEDELATKIATLRELSISVSSADRAKLQDQVVQLQWMLNQIRGEGAGSRSLMDRGRESTPQRDGPGAGMSPSIATRIVRGSHAELKEIPIE